MEIQLAVFLYVYLAFLAIFLFFTFFNLYHMLAFGFSSVWAYILTFSYIGLSIVALLISYGYIVTIDWSQTISILNDTSSLGF